MYSPGWKSRSLRTFSVETRLAVRLATQPDSETTAEHSRYRPAGKNGNSGRADFVRQFPVKREDDIQIVNHEIQHDIDIQAARREHAQPVYFEEKRNSETAFGER